MLFSSIHFLIFLPLVVSFYFLIPHSKRWVFLLMSSYYFYMCWNPAYILLIIASTLVDYFAALRIGRAKNKFEKQICLFISICVNLGILFSFKYLDFFSGSFSVVLNQFNIFYNIPQFNYLLPVGISFYTFQTLGYTIDVYRGKIKPEKKLGIFALYVSFFPQLVAGPIERAKNLLPQFLERHNFDYKRTIEGCKLILWGLFKKVVIADRLALFVDQVYNQPAEYQGISLAIATVFFAFQIYCDFSGYSDMAIGMARIMGFRLMSNFKKPYHAKSVAEFWKRWHISLSSWFRDYLYIPLGGSRVTIPRWYLNLFIVFLISGLWHGANWTFIIWGVLHAFYMIFPIITRNAREKFVKFTRLNKVPRFHSYLQVVLTFILVCFGWIFFRANNIYDAFYILKHIFLGWENILAIDKQTAKEIIFLKQGCLQFVIVLVMIIFMELVHFIERHKDIKNVFNQKSFYFRFLFFSIIILLIIFLGKFENNQFIYFQF